MTIEKEEGVKIVSLTIEMEFVTKEGEGRLSRIFLENILAQK